MQFSFLSHLKKNPFLIQLVEQILNIQIDPTTLSSIK